jgi:hypothetical protein
VAAIALYQIGFQDKTVSYWVFDLALTHSIDTSYEQALINNISGVGISDRIDGRDNS